MTMPSSLKRFFAVLAACAVVSAVLALVNGRTLASFIDLGSVVGALSLLLGGWRLQYGGNDAIEEAHMIQRSQNLDARREGRVAMHEQIVPLFLSPGPLFFAGLLWLVALQTVRYTFGIVL